MRGRTCHPTTAPDPAGPDDDRVVYSLTDAGRQALEDSEPPGDEPQNAPPGDDGTTPSPTPHKARRGTVCGRFRDYGRVPDLRMSGWWLRRAGFGIGQRYDVRVEAGRLTIEAATG